MTALCASSGVLPEMWDLDATDEAHKEAERICRRCPRRLDCLAEAQGDRRLVGVWGGVLFSWTRTGKRRRTILGEEHGTLAGAKRHQREGTRPCLECLEARRRDGRRRYLESLGIC